jgi:PAS domain S-box-containing protein
MGEDRRGEVDDRLAEEVRALRAEVAILRERNAALEAVLEVIDDAVYLKDRRGRYRIINSAGARMLGRSAEEVIGRVDSELFAPESARMIMERDRRIMAEGIAVMFEDAADSVGADRSDRNTKGPYRDDHGSVIGVVGISRDITDSRRAEEELRQTRELLSRLLDHAPVAIYVTDRDGRLRLVNRAWEEVCRRSRQEAVGHPLEEIFAPETAARFLDQNRRVLEATAPLAFEEEAVALEGLRSLYSVKFPLCDADGGLVAVGGISLDITERKRAEAERARHAQILAHVRDSVIVTDREGIVTYWNEGATRLFGWTAEEMLGRPLVERVPEAERERMSAASRAIAEGKDFAGQWEDYRKDGSRVWIEARVTRITDATGAPIGLLGLAYDISERKRAEEALRGSAERQQVLSRRVVEVQEEERRHLARELHDEIGQSLTAIAVNLQAVRRW